MISLRYLGAYVQIETLLLLLIYTSCATSLIPMETEESYSTFIGNDQTVTSLLSTVLRLIRVPPKIVCDIVVQQLLIHLIIGVHILSGPILRHQPLTDRLLKCLLQGLQFKRMQLLLVESLRRRDIGDLSTRLDLRFQLTDRQIEPLSHRLFQRVVPDLR